MYHLRHPDSTRNNPRSWCGGEPERSVLGHAERVDESMDPFKRSGTCQTIPKMTEWEWVKHSAAGHPHICQACVAAITRKPQPKPQEPEAMEAFDDSLPF